MNKYFVKFALSALIVGAGIFYKPIKLGEKVNYKMMVPVQAQGDSLQIDGKWIHKKDLGERTKVPLD